MRKNKNAILCLLCSLTFFVIFSSCKVSTVTVTKYVCIGCGTEYTSKTDCENCNVGENCPKKSIGEKSEPDSLYDIVFSDGSAIAYSEDLVLTPRQKKNIEAVIFYVGTEEEGNTLGKRILGVNVKNNKAGKPFCWAAKDAKGYNNLISDIYFDLSNSSTKPSSGAYYYFEVNLSTKKNSYYIRDTNGCLNGKNNWSKICEIDPEGTTVENRKVNYPAFDYVLTELGEDYYIPSIGEAFVLGNSKVNDVLKLINGDLVVTEFWTSNLHSATYAYTYYGKCSYEAKDSLQINSHHGESTDIIHILTVGIKEF